MEVVRHSSSQFHQKEVDNNSSSEVVELARTSVDILNKQANWGEYSKHLGLDSKEGDELMSIRAKIDGRLAEVARRRAEASGRNFDAVYADTYLEYCFNMKKIMEEEMVVDPREAVVMKEEMVVVSSEEEVCGVCQEEFEVGEEVCITPCKHKFHGLCLWKWLSDRKTCPLCRFNILS